MIEVDNHKLMYHPERIAELIKSGDCYPIYVEIGPTNICNHECVFCALDFLKHKGYLIDSKVILNALKDMSDHGVRSVMFAGEGEPLAHRNIEVFIQEAKKYGLDVSLTTNGVFLNKKRIENILPSLSWIRFSIDSGSSENYAYVHGTNDRDFERVIENIKNCVEYKKKNNLATTIGTQFLAIPQNVGEIKNLARKLKDIGVDNLQIKPYSKHPNSVNSLVISVGEFNNLEEIVKEFRSDEFDIIFRKQTAKRIDDGIDYKECYGLPFFALIDAKGNVIPCNLFYNNEEFTYGNLYKNTFSEIWMSEKRKDVLKRIREDGVTECRYGCRLDVINRYLDRIKNPQLHDNFI